MLYSSLEFENNFREECNENCKARRRDTENDLKQLRRDLKIREEQFRQLEREVQVCSNILFLRFVEKQILFIF